MKKVIDILIYSPFGLFQWPVGLKNVGQTCWFSAVVQSLFSLSAFRNLVLNFQPSESALTGSDRTNKIEEFMLELRRLFALMICSRRKYVDPSRAVEILKGSMNAAAGDNNQQDVSEFTHIVFEWMEEAFKRRRHAGAEDEMMEEEAHSSDVRKEGPNKNLLLLSSASASIGNEEPLPRLPEEGNPMAELFYGQLKVEGNSHGNPISRVEAFGQYPLQVNGFSDIHASLENSICGDDFDSTPNSVMERWITKIPPVLVFSLSRFQFNQERRLAEKVHNRLDFPDVLYMDRYLEVNKEVTRGKREEVRRLNQRREELMAKLIKVSSFVGSGDFLLLNLRIYNS
jgi:ubiquitin carboxyl-terminal hydrolase 25/28